MKINIHTHLADVASHFSLHNICIGVKNLMPDSFFSVGIHPWFIDSYNQKIAWSNLLEFVNFQKFYAIGEIGLDKVCGVDFAKQKFIFEKQLMLADELKVPVIIHCVKCYDVLFYFRKKYPENIWILHDFNGNLQIYKQFAQTNTFFSLGNNFMRKKSKVATILSDFDLGKIFFETDTHTYSIDDVYRKAIDILSIEQENLEHIIYQNFLKIF